LVNVAAILNSKYEHRMSEWILSFWK
jgi:hypothetical protein